MEVKPGYKQTEVGVIPEEWEVAPLSKEIEHLAAGISVNSCADEIDFDENTPAILKTSSICDGTFFPKESKKIIQTEIKRAILNPCANTILISRMNTPDLVGECGYVYKDFPNLFLPDRLWISQTRKESEVCIKWLSYLLASRPYKTVIKCLATGTSGSMKNIQKDALLSLLIAYPSNPEQQAIAEALSNVDALIDGIDLLIAKKRDLKQAAMQELLTGRTRLPGFSGEWEEKRLGELFEITSSKRVFQSDWRAEGIPFYRARELAVLGEKGKIDNELFITSELYETFRVSYGVPSIGDMLITGVGTLGKVYVIKNNREFYFKDGNIIWLKIGNRMSAEFLRQLYLTEAVKKQVTAGASGTTVGTYTISSAKKTSIPFPPLPEQTAIAEVLSDMDAEIEALEARRGKTLALKQGMMQELLTGRIRLV